MKRIFTLLLFLTLVLFIIHSCDYRLWMLKKETLTYKELPVDVKKSLENKLENFDITKDYILFVNESDSSNYKAERVGILWGPKSWVSHIKLTDVRKNIVYKIDRKVPEPYIIYNNKLYILDRYNVRSSDDAKEAIYSKYELK